MITLELQFNCLCLFVADPANRAVHVLMPGTHGHHGGNRDNGGNGNNGHNGHNGHAGHEHVVRMLHRSFRGEQKLTGRDMEGWALTLGSGDVGATTDLLPPRKGGELPDLSDLTGNKVKRDLVGLDPGDRVAARITLRSGSVVRMAHESRWEIKRRVFPLAHQVTWRMQVADPVLTWERLYGRPSADDELPQTLDELEPEDDLGYKLRIFHVTKEALPPKGGVLKPAEMRAHYRAFYPLLDVDDPADELLPRIRERQVVEVNCGAARATVG